jgi:MYXO-CTERM domain-containing protein
MNNFQARYAIRHAWEGAVKCASPRRGIWGGPPGGVANKGIEAAQKLAFAKRGGFDLVSFVAKDDNETKIDSGPLVPAPAMYAAAPDTTPAPNSSAALPPDKGVSGPPSTPPQSGCAGCRVGEGDEQSTPLGAALATAIAFVLARRRR